jgi:hypothetical protein
MSGKARGGNDTLSGRANNPGHLNTLYDPSDTIYGDAEFMSDSARAGNDTLISSADSDHMWGDAQYINNLAASPNAPIGNVRTGADTFVFGVHNGNDDINDFVRAYGFHSFADLTIMAARGQHEDRV